MSWITKGSSKSGKANSFSVGCVSTANSKNDDINDENGYDNDENGNENYDNEATSEEGEHTAEIAQEFYNLCSHIKNMLAKDEYQSWDQGYQDAIALALSKSSTGSGTISSVRKAIFHWVCQNQMIKMMRNLLNVTSGKFAIVQLHMFIFKKY
jgi:hypothetical protein